MKKIYLFCALLIGQIQHSYSQQTASFAQYLFNGLAINPAYAGSHDMLSVSVLSRFQNAGLEGAPKTQTLAVHSPLRKRLAIGALFISDGIGIINQTGMHAAGAYRIFFDEGGEKYLSFGMQFGMINYKANYTDLVIQNPDPVFANNIKQTRPNFGAGIYFRTPEFYLGLSMPHLASNVFDRGENFETIHQSIPVLLTGGYFFRISRALKFKPNFLFKAVDGRPVELDLNASFLLDDLLWVGASYKLPSGLNLLTEFQVTNQLLLGYSYTIAQSEFRSEDLGTHEILLNYRFSFFKSGLVSPRYF